VAASEQRLWSKIASDRNWRRVQPVSATLRVKENWKACGDDNATSARLRERAAGAMHRKKRVAVFCAKPHTGAVIRLLLT
jgi:hypothetical protein